jgi:hypothetical protein
VGRMIVVVVIPVTLGMPGVTVFIPPLVLMLPAVLPCGGQLLPCVDGFSAIPSVMLRGFVEAMVGFGDAALTGIVVGTEHRSGCKRKDACKRSCRKCCP